MTTATQGTGVDWSKICKRPSTPYKLTPSPRSYGERVGVRGSVLSPTLTPTLYSAASVPLSRPSGRGSRGAGASKCIAVFFAIAATATAATFPEKPIRVVVPTAMVFQE